MHALVRRDAPELEALGLVAHRGDITERAGVRDALRGIERLFHAAAWYRVGVRDRTPAYRINVEGTRTVLECARDLGVAKIVYTSTIAVFGDTRGRVVDERYRSGPPFLSEYDRTKWLAHYEVAEPLARGGLPVVIVQPGVVYGPGDHSPMAGVLDRYRRRRLPAVPARTAYCWGHVDDTVDGHVRAMEKGRGGDSYILAGPPHTLAEALRIAESVSGIPAPRVQLPPALLRLAARASELVGGDGEGLRVAAGVTYLGSSAKAERELGFRARPLRDGFAELFAGGSASGDRSG